MPPASKSANIRTHSHGSTLPLLHHGSTLWSPRTHCLPWASGSCVVPALLAIPRPFLCYVLRDGRHTGLGGMHAWIQCGPCPESCSRAEAVAASALRAVEGWPRRTPDELRKGVGHLQVRTLRDPAHSACVPHALPSQLLPVATSCNAVWGLATWEHGGLGGERRGALSMLPASVPHRCRRGRTWGTPHISHACASGLIRMALFAPPFVSHSRPSDVWMPLSGWHTHHASCASQHRRTVIAILHRGVWFRTLLPPGAAWCIHLPLPAMPWEACLAGLYAVPATGASCHESVAA